MLFFRPYPIRPLLSLLAALVGISAYAQTADFPSEAPLLSVAESTGDSLLSWRLRREIAAIDAMREGLPHLADQLAKQVLAMAEIPAESRESMLLVRLESLLILGQPAEALELLNRNNSLRTPLAQALQAIALFQTGRSEEAKPLLRRLQRQDLPPRVQPLLHLLEGFFQLRDNDNRAVESFAQARQSAVDEKQRTLIDLFIRRAQLLEGKTALSDIPDLRRAMRDFSGQRAGFEAARLLAVSLHQAGKTEEALTVLRSQLQMPGILEADLLSHFYLLIGLLAGEQSSEGREALQNLLRQSSDRQLLQNALALLVIGLADPPGQERLQRFLSNLIERNPTHPIMDELLAIRARLFLQAGDFVSAEADARALLDRFPASRLRRQTLWLLAQIAWQRNPPQYRTAVDTLNRLREETDEPRERYEITLLMADCSFLNGDYAGAAVAYGMVQQEAPAEDFGKIILQRTLAELRAGHLELIEPILQEARLRPELQPVELWKAEWNYLIALKAGGRGAQALQHLRRLLADLPPNRADPLRLRLLWLEGRLAVDSQQAEGVPEKMDALLQILQSPEAAGLDPLLLSQIANRARLLKGEALMQSAQPEAALAIFEQIRILAPQSESAVLTYLLEARHFAGVGRFVDAQQRLIALADTRPDARQAPVALWEAALLAEQRGVNSTYLEAIGLLERLATKYSQHPLVFYARMKQGDISRKLNDFPAALVVYEAVIRQFAQHPDRPNAELSRADCYFALSNQNPVRLEDALASYERLFDWDGISADVRAEAGFKWGYVTEKINPARAREIYWMAADLLLPLVENPVSHGVNRLTTGRYWLARSLLQMAELSEKEKIFSEARRAYEILVTRQLPGADLAKIHLERMSNPER